MDYFYCPPENVSRAILQIDGEEFAHLVHVMRKKEGDEIRVVDGRGNAYDVRLEAVKKKTAAGVILHSYTNHHEAAVDVTIAAGILKNPSKFDFLVEKVTEIGVKKIVPLCTERTIPSHIKVSRLRKIALAAMKQAGRSFLPEVAELTSLDEAVDKYRFHELKIIAHEKADDPFGAYAGAVASARSVIVLIGPEGGFTDSEVAKCAAAGFLPVNYGERRFRTETAAVVAAASVILRDFGEKLM